MSDIALEQRATWSTEYINNLADSAFLYIEPGGQKDAEGKTTPRSLRHFPYKDDSGKVDLPHLRDALGRIPQSDVSADAKQAATAKARSILANANRSSDSAIERRSVDLSQVEFREQSDKLIFEGRAAAFGEWADLGSFREQIMRGSFRKVIAKGVDTVFALNHNYDFTMARTSVPDGPGMLVLSESGKGLETYAELAPTSAARDLKVLVDTGVIRKMSFGWPRGAAVDNWNDDYTERSISEFTDLIDVSPVVHPAYAGTQASMRDIVSAMDREELLGLLDLSNATAEQVARAIALEPTSSAAVSEGATGEGEAMGHPRMAAFATRQLSRRLAQRSTS